MIIWKPLVGECLQCVKEPINKVEKNTVAVACINSYCKEEPICNINLHDSIYVLSLPHCALDIFVTGKRVNHGAEDRLEILANVISMDLKMPLNWIKHEIAKIEEILTKPWNTV